MRSPDSIARDTANRQRLWAGLLALGACILIYRASAMIAGGALTVLMPWVAVLTVVELVISSVTLFLCLRWATSAEEAHASLALGFGAATALLHAFRVGIFVLGRAGPWLDFDVRPEHRLLHETRWAWWQVYFAGTLSVLAVLAVIVIWRIRRRRARAR